ncbi:tyrosine-type recombinase/integrase [Parabacteroides pacaensis]|uniref:tyrosine-type recombinase/integrase n=1 Tax=Parabacteroides pacaensis TaxID=2086575 RepID=UPI00131B3641|nr:site-specific integrase [Parabacteroides pacaensis]
MANILPYLVDKNREITSIQFIIRKNGQRYRYVPGITVQTEHWIDNKRWCREGKKYPDGFIKNEQIKKYIRIIDDVLIEFDLKLITPTQQLFKKSVDAKIQEINNKAGGITKQDNSASTLTQYIKKAVETADKTKITYKSYKTTLNQLEAFERENNLKIYFNDINLNFYNVFRNFLLEKTYFVGKEERHYSKNYLGAIFKNIIKFMNDSAGEYHNNTAYKHKGFKKEKEEIETIYLTNEEIQKLYNLKIDEEKIHQLLPDRAYGYKRIIEALQHTQLIFLVGCYTGLRISDYSRIEDFNINEDIIRVRTTKTNKIVYIPIHEKLRALFKKTNVLALTISGQKLNKNIKELGKLAGINEEIKISRTEGGQIVTRTYKKYELICTHTARRSFATNAYLAGIDLYAIKEMLGHSKIETTINYLKVSEEENAKRIAQHPFFKGEVKNDTM